MAKGAVTQRSVAAIRPGDRDQFLWDDKLPGFGLRCLKGTGRKCFVVQWKRDGRTRQLVLGLYPIVKAEEARRNAVEILAAVGRGEDPAAERDAAKASPTFVEVCDRWLALGVGPKGKLKRATTLAMDRGRVEAHIRPHVLGRMRVRAVTGADVWRWLADVIEGKTAVDVAVPGKPRSRRIVKGGPAAGARTLRMLRAAFAYAVRQGLIADNPAREVHPPENAERERERFLSPDELVRLGEALSAAEQAGTAWQAIGCIKLLLATGLRRDEALSLRWSDIDFDRRRLILPETKTGRSVRPLSRPAMAILTGFRGLSRGSWVFPATKGQGHYVGLQKVWSKVRSAAGLDDVRLHDLRHTVGATAVGSGASLIVVGRLLGHRKARSTERYAHVAPDTATAAADDVAGAISDAIEGRVLKR
jgi:integrase